MDNHHEGLLDSLPAALLLVGRDGRLVYANPWAAGQMNCPSAELVGRPVQNVWPLASSAGFPETLKRCLWEGRPLKVELSSSDDPEGESWFEVIFQPVTDGVLVLAQDVTARTRNLLEAEAREEKARALMDAHPDSLVLMSDQGEIQTLNQAAAKVLGGVREDMIGRSLLGLVAEDLEEPASVRFREMLEAGQPGLFRKEYRGRFFDNHFLPLSDARGGFRVALCSRDVTELVDEANDCFREFQRNDSLWRVMSMVDAPAESIQDRIQEELKRLTGSSKAWFISLDLSESCEKEDGLGGDPVPSVFSDLNSEDRTMLERLSQDAFRLRTPVILNTGAAGKGNGPATRWLAIPVIGGSRRASLAVMSGKGSDYTPEDTALVLDFATVSQVIHERRLAVAEARWKNRTLNAINKVFRDALSCEGEEDLLKTCLSVASTLTDSMFGWIGEIFRPGHLDLIVVSDPGWRTCAIPERERSALLRNLPFRSFWGRILTSGRSQIINDPQNDPDRRGLPEGHPELTCFLGVPLKRGSQTLGMIGLANKPGGYDVQDLEAVEVLSLAITEAMASKKAVWGIQRLSEKLVQSNKDLEQFAYVASHDLQEPLRKITAFGHRLADSLNLEEGTKDRDYLQRMIHAAERMQQLIDDLLMFSRLSTVSSRNLPVHLNKIMEEVLSDLETRITETGARIKVGVLPALETDPLQIKQLFQNLLGNAIKFRHPDRAPVISVQARSQSGDRVDIVVQDNGIGFDPKHADRIFNPFLRLHGRTAYEGSGMGLAICQKLVRRLNGTLTAEGSPGSGSTFWVTLPTRRPKEEE